MCCQTTHKLESNHDGSPSAVPRQGRAHPERKREEEFPGSFIRGPCRGPTPQLSCLLLFSYVPPPRQAGWPLAACGRSFLVSPASDVWAPACSGQSGQRRDWTAFLQEGGLLSYNEGREADERAPRDKSTASGGLEP